MKGDFTIDRFDPAKGFNRLLKQQGRVELDSDWNEQAAIQQHLLRGLIVDLMGPAAGPADNCGFGPPAGEKGVEAKPGDFIFGAGRYYVDGLVIENPEPLSYASQRWADPDSKLESGVSYLAFLDVWERHVTWLDDPEILEPALGGPDSCTRVQTVWQVRTIRADEGEEGDNLPRAATADVTAIKREMEAAQAQIDALEKKAAAAATAPAADQAAIKAERAKLVAEQKKLKAKLDAAEKLGGTREEAGNADPHARCNALLRRVRGRRSGRLAARITPSEPSDSPCVLPPESRYRGLENQLYRVEVHQTGETGNPDQVPTFKWSRDNGATAALALGVNARTVRVSSARGFTAGCWVELLTEAQDAQGLGGFLAKVVSVEGNSITLDQDPANLPAAGLRPRVRRWDGVETPITAGEGDQGWIAIEDGIAIRFTEGSYRAGDYWQIPARVATGAILWPKQDDDAPADLPPRGIVHHYAPLFILTATDSKPFATLEEDCRCQIARLPCIDTNIYK